MIECQKYPLSFFVDKIERGEPFSSLLYGDGEWNIITGRVPIGTPYTQYREIVTEKMQQELRDSLDSKDENVYRGSDPHLLNWETYQGTDLSSVRSCSEPIQSYLVGKSHDWYDGTMWDEAVRNGELGPFLNSIKSREVCLVGNEKLVNEMWSSGIIQVWYGYHVPNLDGCNSLDYLETRLSQFEGCSSNIAFLFCMGLGAIPLIMRLRKKMPEATFIDLGSVLDVFVGLGGERGWRRELYSNPDKLKQVIDKNLEGVI